MTPQLIKITSIENGIATYKFINTNTFKYNNYTGNLNDTKTGIPTILDMFTITDFNKSLTFDVEGGEFQLVINNNNSLPKIEVNHYYVLENIINYNYHRPSEKYKLNLNINYTEITNKELLAINKVLKTNIGVFNTNKIDGYQNIPFLTGEDLGQNGSFTSLSWARHSIPPLPTKEPSLEFSDFDPSVPIDNPTVKPIKLENNIKCYLELTSFLRIGSVDLTIPPQNINIRKELKTDNVEVLRGSGTLKQIDRMDSYIIHLKLTFNTIEDINNELSRLISQIKRTPFLPIRNYMLTVVHEIDALCIKECSISTVPQFPNTLQVDIVAEPFNWRSYLNMQEGIFEDTFCWPLFNMWCYDRSDSIKLNSNFTGSLSIEVPDEDKIKNLLELNNFVNKRLIGERKTEREILGVKIPGLTSSPLDLGIDATLGFSSYEIDRQTLGNASSMMSVGKIGRIGFLSSNIKSDLNVEDSGYIIKDSGEFKAVVKLQNTRSMVAALGLHLKDSTGTKIKFYKNDQVVPKQQSEKGTDSPVILNTELTPEEVRSLLNGISSDRKSRNPNGTVDTNFSNYWVVIPQGSELFKYINLTIGTTDKQIKNNSDFFKRYELSEETSVTDINIILTTKVASHSKQQEEHPVHQCLGTGDSVVTLTGITRGTADVVKIKQIIDDVTNLSKFFRSRPLDIDYYGFINIDNEILNLAGITTLIPVGITLSSIEGYPNTYSFNLQLIQYKNTQRSPEDLKNLNAVIENYSLKLNGGEGRVHENQVDTAKRNLEGNYVFQFDPKIRQKNKPLSKTPFDTKFDRLNRSVLVNTTLRMFNLYPDLELPTKIELNYWIELLKYSLNNEIKDTAGRELVENAMIGVDKDSFIYTVPSFKSSYDKLGYAEPDFYCIPDVDHSNMVDKLIKEFQDTQTIGKDQFGVRMIQDAYKPLGGVSGTDPYPLTNPDNPYYTNSDIKAAEEQEKKLGEIREKWNTGKLPTNSLDTHDDIKSPEFIRNRYGTIPHSWAWVDGKYRDVGAEQWAKKNPDLVEKQKKEDEEYEKTKNLKDVLTKPFDASIFSRAYNPQMPVNGGWKDHSPSFTKLDKTSVEFVREVLQVAKGNPKFFGPDPRIAGILQEIDENVVYAIMARETNIQLNGAKKGGVMQVEPKLAYEHASIYKEFYTHFKGFATLLSETSARPLGDSNTSENPFNEKQLEGFKFSTLIGIEYLISCYLANKEKNGRLMDPTERAFKAFAMYNGGGKSVDPAWSAIQKNGSPQYGESYVRTLRGNLPSQYALAVMEMTHELKSRSVVKTILENDKRQNTPKETLDFSGPVGSQYGPGLTNKIVIVDTNLTEKVKYNPLSVFDKARSKDFQGRLVNAFPTYFVCIVDGGQYIGIESMWDHFYGRMGITSIDITSNRKRPTDVAVVGFSNLYGKLTSTFADIDNQKALNVNYRWGMETITHQFEQFLTPWATDEYTSRWKKFFDTLLVKPGARLHVRLGFSSNASLLPVKFNGVITEVPTQDNIVEIVALGDGVELEKPMPTESLETSYTNDGKQVLAYKDAGIFGTGGRSPRQMLAWMLGPRGMVTSRSTQGVFDNKNPYGIIHFGEHDYREIVGPDGMATRDVLSPTVNLNQFAGETVINVYDGTEDPEQDDQIWRRYWDTFGLGWFGRDNTTIFGIQVEEATPWSIVQTCRNAVPDFIAAVRPYEFRSTLFFGKAEFPINYKYKTFYTEKDLEKIKKESETNFVVPLKELQESQNFSQLHFILTGHNLLAGNIIASSNNVYTNCLGKYYYDSFRPFLGGQNFIGGVLAENETDLMQADIDIFEEEQKTKVVKTGLRTGTFQELQGFRAGFMPAFANTSAAMGVRDSVADMYEGYHMIIGDPTIFTWDYIYVMDSNSLLHGGYQVKEVNNHFSVESGYITLVSPDAIVNIAGRVRPTFINTTFGIAKSVGATLMLTNLAAKKLVGNTPYITVGKMLSKIVDLGVKIPFGLANKASGYEKAISKSKIGTAFNENEKVIATKEAGSFFKGLVSDIFQRIKDAAGKKIEESTLKQAAANSLFEIYVEAITKNHEMLEKNKLVQYILERTIKGKQMSFEIAKAIKALGQDSIALNNRVVQSLAPGGLGSTKVEAYTKASAIIREDILLKLEEEIKRISGGVFTVEKAVVGASGPSNSLIIKLVQAPAGTVAKTTVGKGISSTILNASRIIRGSNVITFLLSCATTSLFGGITEWKNRNLLRRKCVIIYPLMIAGKEFSAGIRGHMGSVAGDMPSHSDIFWKTIFNSEASKKSDNLALNLWGYMLPVLDAVLIPGLDEANLPEQQQGSTIENPFKNSIYDSMSSTDRDLNSLEFNSFAERLLGNNKEVRSTNNITNSNVHTKNGIVTNPNIQEPDSTSVEIPSIRDNSNRVVYTGHTTPKTAKSLIEDLNKIAMQQGWNTVGISSAFRTEEENRSKGGRPQSKHLTSNAVDVSSINGIALKSHPEGKKLGDTLVTELTALGYHNVRSTGGRGRFIWQEKGHLDHVHVDTGL